MYYTRQLLPSGTIKKIITLFLLFSFFNLSIGQQPKKVMDEKVYAIWNTIQKPVISNDGNWVVYQLTPGEGDTHLKIFNTKNKKEHSFERGLNAKITDDSHFVVFQIKPPVDTIKAMKRRKVKKKNLPKDSLGIYDLERNVLVKIPEVKSFKVPEKWNGYIAYLRTPQVFEKGDSSTVQPKKKETKDSGTRLMVRALQTGQEEVFEFVQNYIFAKEGERLMFSSTGNDTTFLAGVYLFDFGKKDLLPLHRQQGKYKKITFDEQGTQAAFLANVDTTHAQVAPFQLHFWKEGKDSAQLIFTNENVLLQHDWIVSEYGQLFFSKNAKRLFFGVAPPPILQDTSLLEEEIVNVEVWSYTDKVLHTRQKNRLEKEKKRAYLTVYDISKNRFQQLGDLMVEDVRTGDEGNADIVLGYDQKPYEITTSWEGGPSHKDLYINKLGENGWQIIARNIRGTPHLSPHAKYVYWYSTPDTAWFTYSIENRKITQVTNNKISKFYDELNDRPMHPWNYSMAGWTTDDAAILIYDRYDIWKIDPEYKSEPVRLTKGREADSPTVFRYVKLDKEEREIDLKKDLFVHFFNTKNKQEGYGKWNPTTRQFKKMTGGDYAYTRRPQKARDVNVLLFTKENFQVFPDLRVVKKWDFSKTIKVSEANPQQSEYKWGTIELYSWRSLDGQKLEGMLVKPEGFDPKKKYPMIVNFYERSSDRLHRHRAPFPHRSTINYSYYSNRGYLIFNPDVPYRVGYPGESALNAVVPGVTSLIEKGFVDAKNIGLQGHSWGGYQAAYLVTKTNIFKCAESGAPVVNMISAYGGIRWGSGMSRMFQYEHTQSRIGGTLWEYPLRYIENSPIFFVDKIQTPLLILHN
ncbi:MAG TPA: S9 family peptidase, partial [Phaeodactylibacter sp.]|nr:S9 family peptidase [Phaeodactylibacter sp.]